MIRMQRMNLALPSDAADFAGIQLHMFLLFKDGVHDGLEGLKEIRHADELHELIKALSGQRVASEQCVDVG